MIYLFTNMGYGRAFINAAIQFAIESGHGIALVFAEEDVLGAADKHAGRISVWLRAARRLWAQFRLKHRYRLRTVLVGNVNGKKFLRRVAKTDIGVIAGFRRIFKSDTIHAFQSLVNFHPSLLPLYRGPVPSYWCIGNGETRSGFSLHEVTEKIDAGRILFQQAVPILSHDTPQELDARIAAEAAPIFRRYLEHRKRGAAWEIRKVDASEIYKCHQGYASFPSRDSLPRASQA